VQHLEVEALVATTRVLQKETSGQQEVEVPHTPMAQHVVHWVEALLLVMAVVYQTLSLLKM
jgi:hypothetical protein